MSNDDFDGPWNQVFVFTSDKSEMINGLLADLNLKWIIHASDVHFNKLPDFMRPTVMKEVNQYGRVRSKLFEILNSDKSTSLLVPETEARIQSLLTFLEKYNTEKRNQLSDIMPEEVVENFQICEQSEEEKLVLISLKFFKHLEFVKVNLANLLTELIPGTTNAMGSNKRKRKEKPMGGAEGAISASGLAFGGASSASGLVSGGASSASGLVSGGAFSASGLVSGGAFSASGLVSGGASSAVAGLVSGGASSAAGLVSGGASSAAAGLASGGASATAKVASSAAKGSSSA